MIGSMFIHVYLKVGGWLVDAFPIQPLPLHIRSWAVFGKLEIETPLVQSNHVENDLS